jgi:hypothetical protein
MLMQDWASYGVRKLEEALGADGDLARIWDEDACGFIVGASASMDKTKATRMKRLYDDALIVLGGWVCLYGSGVLTGAVQRRSGRGLVVPILFSCFAQLCGGRFCFLCVMNPVANVGPWQWGVGAMATAMQGGGGEANSNGG